MRRLTDIWQNLLGGVARDPAELERERLARERSERIDSSYRNLYWTGLISVDSVAEEALVRHPLAEDIIEALQEIEES